MASFLRTAFRRLNVITECRSARLELWECPPFLFIIMGIINILGMISSYLFASRFIAEPEVAATIVIGVSLVIFIVGTLVINGFQQIAEANRIKSEFIAIVSHQLRSPLSIFKWTLDLMERSEESPAGSGTNQASSFSVLRENTSKMIQLVNMLLEVSRIEGGRMVLRSEPVHIGTITTDMIHSYAPYAEAAKITLTPTISRATPAVRGDPEKLKMVIQNLIDNAIRYSHKGGNVSITVEPRDSSFVEWKISDQGIGIPKDQQRYIFQKFFRSSHAIRQKTEGSGLGLYIARSVITALHGRIGFSSKEGQGSAFWFELPVYQ